jgi:hypothetical protein
MAHLAQWGPNQGWRWRSRGFAGAWPAGGGWPFAGVWPDSSYPYNYGYDPDSYGYGYPSFTYGWYDPSHGYGFDPYTHGSGYGPYGYSYGYGESYSPEAAAPAYESPRSSYLSAGGPRYAVYSYPVAPSAKIIHLTPRQ